MPAVLPIHAAFADQLQIGLLHQTGGVQQRPAPAVAGQLAMGNSPQLVVDHRHHPVEGLAIAGVVALQ